MIPKQKSPVKHPWLETVVDLYLEPRERPNCGLDHPLVVCVRAHVGCFIK